jgi:ABC-type multidrug transport system ATPase subunit
MKIIAGMLSSDPGSVQLRGRLAYCPQAPKLWNKLAVAKRFRLFAAARDLDADEAKR